MTSDDVLPGSAIRSEPSLAVGADVGAGICARSSAPCSRGVAGLPPFILGLVFGVLSGSPVGFVAFLVSSQRAWQSERRRSGRVS